MLFLLSIILLLLFSIYLYLEDVSPYSSTGIEREVLEVYQDIKRDTKQGTEQNIIQNNAAESQSLSGFERTVDVIDSTQSSEATQFEKEFKHSGKLIDVASGKAEVFISERRRLEQKTTGNRSMMPVKLNPDGELSHSTSSQQQVRMIQGEKIPLQATIKEPLLVKEQRLQPKKALASDTDIFTTRVKSSDCGQTAFYAYESSPTSDELFIISQLKYGDQVLSDEMFAYQQGGVQYLPIQLLAELLLLPVQLDSESLSLSGWFLSPERKIELSNGLLSYWYNKGACGFPDGEVFFDDWDLYLDRGLIEHMFGLNIRFDASRQRFTIQTSNDIPLSQLLAREQKFKAFEAEQKKRASQQIMLVESLDANIGDLAGHIDLGVVSQRLGEVNKTSDEGFIQGRSDLGGHNAYLGYSWSDSGKYINGYIEKFLSDQWVKHYRVGSVDSHSLPLVSESSSGLGVIITAGDGFTDDFRHIVIEGEIEPDWDVELYRNNSLIAIQRVGADARYRFTEVPYYIGTNQYQLRFFGPSGESRSESFSKVLDQSVLEQGSVGVSAGAMVRDQDHLKQYYLHTNWAVTENITTGLSLINQELADGDWQFLPKLSMNLLGGENLLQFNLAHSGDGYALGAALQGSSDNFDWNADWQFFENFNSWESAQTELIQEANLSLNTNIEDSSLSLALSANWKEYMQLDDFLQINAQLAGQFNRLSYSNNIRWQSNGSQEIVSDRIAISGKLFNWYLRSYLDIDILPEFGLNQWVVNANTALSDDFNYQLELSYQAQEQNAHSIRNSISYLFDQSSLRLVLENFSDGDWFAQLKWSSSFLWQPSSGLLLRDSASYLNTGAIIIKAFQDDNANGELDEGELPVKGLSFSGHSRGGEKTDNNGELLITHLQTAQAQKLKLNEASLPDPFLIPLASAISVKPHPGHIEKIPFPILYTAEMEGQLLTTSGAVAKGVPIKLQSHTAENEYAVRVEFDGVFIFERILPGSYKLIVGDKFHDNVDLKPGEYLDLGTIALTGEGNVIH
ncbi:carboxypeptidase regulatory-like domain-containing protein [Shewanella sp. NR704-98]|uniref:Carboxypeptidase regulatory-like domain-containing protein n=2 Tax=Shewanella nanhaiensis TaxID=2864872 RepID=A0ABS7E635_9GAMM|nr:carboxypeptidase regulatory-like domain-containing protein [Shewanella nanhaiensis]MBW8184813.1 carboxypeptidase regulatory-like domain-containing protein [Shewanella nanhaiensis]